MLFALIISKYIKNLECHASCYCFCSIFNSTDCVTEMKCTVQSFESRMNVTNMNSITTHHSSK